MVVHTTDAQSTLARKQQLEFTLLNHPVDCPICDKAGECTLQKLYFEHDNADSRVDVPKVHKAKVVDLGPTIVLDQERCILCSRCIRACDEVAGQHQLEFAHRGDHEILTTAPGEQLDNPYSLNTVDVCPVGALTAKDFRFTMRAWELEATPSVCNGCATGCNIEIHHKNERAWRLVPRHNADVNEYWMCDEGRFTYHDLREQRLAGATVDGLPAGWDRAIRAAADRLGVAPQAAGRGSRRRAVGAALERGQLRAREARAGVGRHQRLPRREAAGARARRWQAPRRRHQPEPGGREGDRRGPRPHHEAGLRARRPIRGAGRSRSATSCRASIRRSSRSSSTSRSRRTSAARSRTRRSRCRSRTGPRSPARSRTRRATCSGCTRRSARRARRSPGGKRSCGSRGDTGTARSSPWSHARDVFKDMVAAVPAWNGLTWAREARPLSLRFAGSRG